MIGTLAAAAFLRAISDSRAAALSGASAYSFAASGAPPRRSASAINENVPNQTAATQHDALAGSHRMSGLDALSGDARLPRLDRLRCQAPRPVEPRRPEPLVETDAGRHIPASGLARIVGHPRRGRGRFGVAFTLQARDHPLAIRRAAILRELELGIDARDRSCGMRRWRRASHRVARLRAAGAMARHVRIRNAR